MIAGPMTFVLVLVVAGLLLMGVYMVYRALAGNAGRRLAAVCPNCRQRNPGHANFCAHCGQPLK